MARLSGRGVGGRCALEKESVFYIVPFYGPRGCFLADKSPLVSSDVCKQRLGLFLDLKTIGGRRMQITLLDKPRVYSNWRFPSGSLPRSGEWIARRVSVQRTPTKPRKSLRRRKKEGEVDWTGPDWTGRRYTYQRATQALRAAGVPRSTRDG